VGGVTVELGGYEITLAAKHAGGSPAAKPLLRYGGLVATTGTDPPMQHKNSTTSEDCI
jgi:hypothetical protein